MTSVRPHIPRILFAGGGTGGHVYPAIAIADAVRTIEPSASIAFVGTRERIEWTAVPRAGYPVHPITISGLHRKLTVRNLTFPLKLFKGLIESWSLVGAFDPDVVVGTGGYVSGPVLWTADLRGRRTLIQEQNAYAGVTNRLLGRRADSIHIAFPEAERYFPAGRCKLSGNPVRTSLTETSRQAARAALGIPDAAQVLFVFGGSLGSRALNDAMSASVRTLLERPDRFILWQTGPRYFEEIRPAFGHERLQLMAFVDRMDRAYAASDLVVCRAGAITCSELMATGSAAVLVPSKNVAEDHQTKNATSLATRNAAALLAEKDLDKLVDTIESLFGDPARLAKMGEAARAMARPDAAVEIARDVLALASGRAPRREEVEA
jgi:UDP-N-acetylglucosamine--N-acetylmuramyl-(pentapeptide) pyrophosphoryl-undecaprenol N-acetylglucosamine transferase